MNVSNGWSAKTPSSAKTPADALNFPAQLTMQPASAFRCDLLSTYRLPLIALCLRPCVLGFAALLPLFSLSSLLAQDQTVNGNLTVNGQASATQFIATGGSIRMPGNAALTAGATPVLANVSGFGLQISTYQFGIATNAGTTPNFTIIGNGNVGIGTTNPSVPLDVKGNARFGENSFLNIIDTGGGNGRLAFSGIGALDVGSDLYFRNAAGTTEYARITSAGNVGIGTASPGYKLDVAGDAKISGNLTVNGEFSAPAYAATGGTLTGSSTAGLTLKAGGTDKNVVLAPSGNGAVEVTGGIRVQGSFNQFDYVGEKTLAVSFPNGVANQKVQIYFDLPPSTQVFWGNLEVELTASYNYQNSVGSLKKVFSIGLNPQSGGGPYTPSSYNDTAYYTQSAGLVSDNWAIDGVFHDSATGRYYFTIVHRVPTGNTVLIKVRGFGATKEFAANIATLTAGPVYTTDPAIYQKPVVEYRSLRIGYSGSQNIEQADQSLVVNGKIGIGTATPLGSLHVVTPAASGRQDLANIDITSPSLVRVTNPQYSTLASTGMVFRVFPDSDTRQGAGLIASGGANNGSTDLAFFTATSTDGVQSTFRSNLFLQGISGNVGIGTQAPNYKLDVAGDIAATAGDLMAGNSGDTHVQMSKHSVAGYYAAEAGPRWVISRDAVGGGQAGIGFAPLNGGSIQNFIATNRQGNLGLYAGGESLTVTSGGNVGVGTTAPGAKFHVQSDATEIARFDGSNVVGGFQQFAANGVPIGFVGFGGTLFSTQDSALFGLRSQGALTFATGGGYRRMTIDAGGAMAVDGPMTVKTAWDAPLTLQTTDDRWLYTEWLTSAGTRKFWVGLDAGLSWFNIQPENGAYGTTIGGILYASGNVGIGTATPAAKLDVAGNAKITGTLDATSSGTFGGNLNLTNAQGNNWAIKNDSGNFALSTTTTGGGATPLKFDRATQAATFGGAVKLGDNAWSLSQSGSAFYLSGTAGTALTIDSSRKARFEGAIESASTATFSGKVTASSDLIVNAPGRVGIGTPSPTRALEVNGAPLFVLNNASEQFTLRFPQTQYGALRFQNEWYVTQGGTGWGAEIRTQDIGGGGGNLVFMTSPTDQGANVQPIARMEIKADGNVVMNGNVGIGTAAIAGAKLSVEGLIRAREVVVDPASVQWADYVFADDYRNAPLSEVEAQIKEHKHLPGVPSAKEVADKGVNIGQMQAVLLQKIEELTLHMIEQEKTMKQQSSVVQSQQDQLAEQNARLERLERENAQLRQALR